MASDFPFVIDRIALTENYSYRLAEESDDERVPAIYAFSFSNDGHLQLSFYFDSETDAELAYRILASANGDPATLPDHRIYSQLCFATNIRRYL
jgi:hypothetical protein